MWAGVDIKFAVYWDTWIIGVAYGAQKGLVLGLGPFHLEIWTYGGRS